MEGRGDAAFSVGGVEAKKPRFREVLLLAQPDSSETKARILASLRKRLADEEIKASWPDLLPD